MIILLEKLLTILCLKNKFILFNKYISDSPFTIIFLVAYVCIANVLLLNKTSIGIFIFGQGATIIGVFMYVLIVMNVLLSQRVGLSKFDWTKFRIPDIDEQIVIIKDIPAKYDTYIGGAKKGEVYFITDISYRGNDCYLTLVDKTKDPRYYFNVRIGYLRTRKYWTTKSEMRDSKLEKIIKKAK